MRPLRRRAPHTNLLRPRPLATCPDTDPVDAPHALTLAKIISTLFLLSPRRLTSFPHVITPFTADLSLRRLSDPRTSLSLLRLLSFDCDVALSASTYRHVIVQLLSASLLSEALNLFDEMSQRGLPLDHRLIDFALNSCIKVDDLDGSLQVLSRARVLKSQVRTDTFNKLLSLMIGQNRMQDAISLFLEHSRSALLHPDTWSFNEVIKCCCWLGDLDSAFRFCREMRDFGCMPDTITNNVLIDGLCRVNQVEWGREILHGVHSPSVVSYTTLMKGFCKLGRMEEAKRLFDEMIDVGIKPSRISYNVLIDGYGKIGDMKSSLEVYEKMKMCGCSPDVVTFTSLIEGHCRSGKTDEAMKLWDEMKRRKIDPNVYTFDVVIKSLCKKNRLSEARYLLNELSENGNLVARAFVYNPVIDGLCKAGNLDEANLVFVEMEKRNCRPDKFTYTILIIGHCMKGRMSEAIDLFNRMAITGCSPDSITVQCLVSCLLKAGMPNHAKRILGKSLRKPNRLSAEEISIPLTKRRGVSVAV